MEEITINGWYYSNEPQNFRKYLDINIGTDTKQNPDLMVIMMNPGSSFPLNGDNNGRTLTPAFPDPTQDQIIWFMKTKGYSFARVLNLSDIRDQESSSFYRNINNESNENMHSLFHPLRRQELNELFNKNCPILKAWGVNKKLVPLIDLVNRFLREVNYTNTIFGSLKPKTRDFYYHPKPRFDRTNGEKWRNEVTT